MPSAEPTDPPAPGEAKEGDAANPAPADSAKPEDDPMKAMMEAAEKDAKKKQ
jgi:hypothetical protein